MKPKVIRGNSFRGISNYVYDPVKGAWVVGGNMSGTDPRSLCSEFAACRRLRPEVKNPVWHCSLSLPYGEHLTDEKWNEIAKDFMEAMGFSDLHPYVSGRHNDTDHEHIHNIASRIGLDGQLWHGQHDVFKAIEVCQELEKRHGLTITPGLSIDTDHRASLKRGEVEKALRSGEAPPKLILQNAIDEALKDQPTTSAFIERLEIADISVRPNISTTGRMNGFSVEHEGVAFKASSLGKSYSWNQLQKRGLDYEQTRDNKILIEAKNRSNQQADKRVARATEQQHRIAGQPTRTTRPELSGAIRREQGNDPADSQHSSATTEREQREDQQRSAEMVSSSAGLEHRAEAVKGSDKQLVPSSGANRAAQPRNVAQNMDSSDQYGNTNNTGASQRIRDLSAPSIKRRENSSSLLQRSQPSRPAAHNTNDGVTKMKPKPAHVKAKEYAINEQHKALQSPSYRLTLTARRDNLQTYNLGKNKGPDGAEKFYTAQEVKSLIPTLSRQNARGYDIYVTPISDDHHYLLLDDSDANRLQDLQQKTGIKPAYVQESSPDNLQAIIKADKHQGNQEQPNANSIVQALNKNYGDPKLSGVIHPFRLAGFSNAKPKHEVNGMRPIVRPRPSIVSMSRSSDSRTNALLEKQRKQQQEHDQHKREQQQKQQYQQRQNRIKQHSSSKGDITAEERYRIEAKKCIEFVNKNGWAVDYSKIDFYCSKQMLKDDYFIEQQIEAAIKSCSPEVYTRHVDLEYYAERTVRAASQDPEVRAHRENELELELETSNPQFR